MLVLGRVLFILVLQTKNRLKPACPTSKTPLNEHLFGVKNEMFYPPSASPYLRQFPSDFIIPSIIISAHPIFFLFKGPKNCIQVSHPRSLACELALYLRNWSRKSHQKIEMVRGFGWHVCFLGGTVKRERWNGSISGVFPQKLKNRTLRFCNFGK